MGDYSGSYDHTGDAEVKYVAKDDLEDWSWMHSTRTKDAGALNEGEYYYEEQDCYERQKYYDEDGINYGMKCSDTHYSSQQVARASGRSAPAGHKDDNESLSSKSSEEGEVKVKPKSKKKGARGQFKHLHELPLDAHSDPGYGESYETAHAEHARSQSINLVTSWLRDASLGEHLKDSETNEAQHAPSPPRRPPPPRRHPRRADMAAHSHRRSPSFPGPDHQYDYEAQYSDKTPAYDPSGYHDGYHENHQLAIYNAPATQLAPESLYRPEAKPLDKALKFIRTAAVGVKTKSIEFKNLAVPVLTPILNAVFEESMEQLMGPEPGKGRATPTLERGPENGEGRGQAPMARGRGRGRSQAPLVRPMQPEMRPVMRPTMRPGMMPSSGPRPGMVPLARRPNMRPPPLGGGAPAIAVPVARGRGVAMRGPPRPVGAPQGQARPISLQRAPPPIDF